MSILIHNSQSRDFTLKRIQMKNYYDYSWKDNPRATYVARPSKYGNPFRIDIYGLEECIRLYRKWLEQKLKEDPKFLEPLIGKDLVCYCSLSNKCHADILIEFVKNMYGDK